MRFQYLRPQNWISLNYECFMKCKVGLNFSGRSKIKENSLSLCLNLSCGFYCHDFTITSWGIECFWWHIWHFLAHWMFFSAQLFLTSVFWSENSNSNIKCPSVPQKMSSGFLMSTIYHRKMPNVPKMCNVPPVTETQTRFPNNDSNPKTWKAHSK